VGRISTCDRCGYAHPDCKQVALLIDGKLYASVTLCPAHRLEVEDAVDDAAIPFRRGAAY